MFLEELPNQLATIDGIHRAAREGLLEPLMRQMKTKRLALARDHYGCTPLHTAIIYEQTKVPLLASIPYSTFTRINPTITAFIPSS